MALAPLATQLLLLFQVAGAGQPSVSVSVSDSTSRAPVGGAIVAVVAGDGRTLERHLTGSTGEARVTWAPGGHLDIRRIGFSPSRIAMPASADAGTIAVRLARLPTILSSVRSVADRRCPRRADADRAFALWRQARLGIEAAVIARGARSARATGLVFERQLDDTGGFTIQRVRRKTGQVQASFAAARPAADFLTRGFVERSPMGMHGYYGPDAEVLLDDAFQASYCFSLAAADARHPRAAGLRFAAASHARDRVDIEGTLWVDTIARRLSAIEFRYVGALETNLLRRRPGGVLTFDETASGVPLVSRWSIRAVGVVSDSTSAPLTLRDGLGDSRPHRSYVVVEFGGELARVLWPGDPEWRGSLGSVRLTVKDAQGRPASGAEIRLDGTDYSGTSDTAGVVQIDDLLPGPYAVRVVDTVFTRIGIERAPVTTIRSTRGELVAASMTTWTDADVLETACGGGAADPRSRAIVARVMTESTPLQFAEWQLGERGGVADARGLIFLCVWAIGDRQAADVSIWRRGMKQSTGRPALAAAVPVPSARVSSMILLVPR